jgi:hypothetical protein
MMTRAGGWTCLFLALSATGANADDLVWRPSKQAAPNAASASLGSVGLCRPQPIGDFTSPADPTPLATTAPALVVRAQAPDPLMPPPPPFPGAPVPIGGPYTGPTPYNTGQVNSNADLGFWSSVGQFFKRCWGDTTGAVGGIMQPGQGRSAFQSDHTLDVFASPVSNPFYFTDPRALTEIKPLFIWQHTPSSNRYWNGGDNFFAGVQGSVAFTPWLSLTINKLGATWIEPNNGGPVGIGSSSGFSEIHFGPKVTFIRDCNTGTAAAFGLVFELPVGSASVLQDTGTLSLRPYFSFAQHFGKFQYGSFNFMNTTGYDFSVDNARNDFLFSSFHLDYDIADRHVFYPLVELNWILYPDNGTVRNFGFGGGDLFNFGSNGTAGHDELTVAAGFRWKAIGETLQFGLAGQFSVLGNQGRHLDAFRLTADMIVRY